MDKKTDMTSEFGAHGPGSEFSRPAEAATNQIPEFNHPPDERTAEFYCAADREKEFCRQEESPTRKSRRNHRRGSLLLQMACVALSVVLVTNSFGLDILGDDFLFSAPSDPPAAPPVSSDTPAPGQQEQPTVQEDQHPSPEGWADPPSLYVIPHGEESPVFIVSGGQLTAEGLGFYDLSYDPDTNTLTLDDFWGETICANRMGEDFTIYLKGKNRLNAIYSYGDPSSGNGSLTIDGKFRAELDVNVNEPNPVGIHVFADGGSSRLEICPGIDMKICGSEAAILVSDTSAAVGIATKPCSMISGIAAHLPSEGAEGTSDWFYADPETLSAPLSQVTFDMSFAVGYYPIHKFSTPITLYQGFPTNDIINELEYSGYSSVQNGSEFTVTNVGSPSPVYIYFTRYTNHSEPYLVLWEQDPGNEDDSDVIERDMQGKYFGSGITYLATDGESLYWVEEAGIDGAWLPSDAVRLQPGESISFSLPHDGSDSFYHVFAEAHYPEQDYYYWLYSIIRVME